MSDWEAQGCSLSMKISVFWNFSAAPVPVGMASQVCSSRVCGFSPGFHFWEPYREPHLFPGSDMDARVCSLSTRHYFWAGGQTQAPSGHPLLVIQMARCHHCMGLLSYIREGLLDQELPHWRLQHFCYHFSCPLMPYEGQMQRDDEATNRQVLFTIVPALRVLCETTHMLMVLDAPWDIARLLRTLVCQDEASSR